MDTPQAELGTAPVATLLEPGAGSGSIRRDSSGGPQDGEDTFGDSDAGQDVVREDPAIRDEEGNFFPPQFRFTTVQAKDLKPGDVINWIWGMKSRRLEVVERDPKPLSSGRSLFRVRLLHLGDKQTHIALYPDTTVNLVETCR